MHKVRNINKTKRLFPYGLAVRIPGFHPGGPGSTPGMGTPNYYFTLFIYRSRTVKPL